VKLLAVQLKRIGDLILTTPALAAIKAAHPEAHLTLAVHSSTAALLPAIPSIDAGLVFGPGRGWTPWQQTLTGKFNHVLDFTGTDRSAWAVALSRSRRRVTFDWVRKSRLRSLAYSKFVPSAVREHHTVDHYLHLAESVIRTTSGAASATGNAAPSLVVPESLQGPTDRLLEERGVGTRFALIHPGTARREKFWLPERWAEVIRHLRTDVGMDCVITGGADPYEADHLAHVVAACGNSESGGRLISLAGQLDLLQLAILVSRASLVASCDTAVVHLAAAFQRPQIALFGPTNPFHWRPRHSDAVVLSAAHPEEPLAKFAPRMKGAPMERLSTATVIRATESLLHSTLSP
jgi:ADP-heptose:LPS heptosyltransferase